VKPAATAFDLPTTPIEEGVTLIEASAGTGKTYSLTGLVLRLLLEGHVADVGRILVMTFTNAATAELVDRIRRSLRAAVAAFRSPDDDGDEFLRELTHRHGEAGLRKLERALRDLDDLEVCTIHGFCRRMLDQNAFETGSAFEVEYAADDGVLLTAAAEDFWRRTVYTAGDLVTAVVEHYKWTPSTFLEEYRECRRYPRIEIRPTPLAIGDAVQALEGAAQIVRSAWSAAEIREVLAAAKYKKGERMSAGEQATVVADAESFCVRGNSSALGAVLALQPATMEKRLFAKAFRLYAATGFAQSLPPLADAVAALEHALRCAFIRDVGTILEEAKRANGVAHYDDLLHRLHAALEDPARAPGLRRAAATQYQAVLIDEFQDTDTIQYEIFRRLLADATLILVGDPKQAIYGFRGADVFAYMRAKRDAGRQPFNLDTNYRSEEALVTAVNAVFSHIGSPFVFDAIPFAAVRAAGRTDEEPLTGDGRRGLEWIWLDAEKNKDTASRHAIAATAAEIVRLLDSASGMKIGDRAIEPRDIAVLVRSNRRAEEIQAVLRTAGVPSVVSQAGNVFETDEASELHALLAAIASPRDAGALRMALATRVFGYDAEAIATLGDAAWQELVDRFDELRRTWSRGGFVAMAEQLLTFANARVHLLASTSGARRLTNLLQLIELTEQAVEEHHLTMDGVVAWLARIRARPELFPRDAAEMRLETDADAVQICTVHKSKGLEYRIVFCPFAWDASPDKPEQEPVLVHDPHHDRVIYQYPPADTVTREARDKERISEETRLLYVALTRAKHRCYVVWGNLGSVAAKSSALAHVLHAGAPPEQWRAQLGELCAAHSRVMAVRDWDVTQPIPRWEKPAVVAPDLRERDFPEEAKPRLVPWRVASFSSLRAPVVVAAAAVEIPDYVDPALVQPAEAAAPRGIFAFAKGARAGTCLHEIFENTDFTRVHDDATATLVTEMLRRHDLDDPSAHAARIDPKSVVLEMLADVLDSRLPDANLSLSSVTPDRMLAEWQFHLPMGSVSQPRLADAFARHGRGPVSDRYPSLLRALGTREVHGYLMGFVDLVFMHDDRWYVVDWKSNHLGNDVADYGDDALAGAMCEHHYVLQYHLYTLALHRYLRQRLRGYDYERHLGGVAYAFLRGIRAGSSGGWYFDRPPLVLIEALDAVVQGGLAA
jgi:exodeoxyribonuclease V beta subunit